MKSFVVSVQFLTRISLFPSLNLNERDMARSLYWYPITGLLVGGILGGLYQYCFSVLWSTTVAKAIVVGCLVALKDAFHLEGLSDLADGLYGARDPAAIRQIMKDSSIGAMGCIVMVTGFFLQAILILSLAGADFLLTLPLVLMVSTSAGALLLSWDIDVLTENGLAASCVRYSNPNLAVFLEFVMVIIGYLLMGLGGVILVLSGITISVVFSTWIRDRIGAINGDCCGALIVIEQIGLLLLYQALIRFHPELFFDGVGIL